MPKTPLQVVWWNSIDGSLKIPYLELYYNFEKSQGVPACVSNSAGVGYFLFFTGLPQSREAGFGIKQIMK